MIGIITAMQEEAEHIIKMYWLKNTKKLKNISIYENDNIVLALAWIWKVQASIWVTYLFLNYEISKLINIGIAWSLLWKNASIWDVFLVNKISQHDMYLPFDWSHLDYAKREIVINNNIFLDWDFEFKLVNNSYCLTGDQFIDDNNKVSELRGKYNADVIEMEAFAVASVAREFDKLDNCIFIKAISDWADSDAKDAHMWNLDFAMQNSLKVLEKIIN